MVVQVVLTVITAGLYGLYWYYKVNSQLARGTDASISVGVRMVLFLIPVVNFYPLWQTCQDAQAVSEQSAVILFVLGVVLPPAHWYLIQSGINQTAA